MPAHPYMIANFECIYPVDVLRGTQLIYGVRICVSDIDAHGEYALAANIDFGIAVRSHN